MTHRPFSSPLAIAHIEEFKELARAAGLVCEGVAYQVIKKVDPGFFIGSGKIRELKDSIQTHPVSVVVFEPCLSGIQTRNLEKELGVAIRDRNQLILDIFAQRAHTYPGKLQVELARSLDELPRMVGAWMSSLSRQGGGIGARGPGEKAIEIDRRQVKAHVKKIKKKLEKVRSIRQSNRALRQKNKIPNVALIGYTNSGKSTLLNTLTNASVPAKNLPFMTLDPITRKIYIPETGDVVMTDTVGFIQNLSPHLIEAFKATLEESASADILLHVINLSSPLMKVQMDTVNKLLIEFKWEHKPCIHVYNKIDIAPKEKVFHTNSMNPKVFVSALKNTGLEKLKVAIKEALNQFPLKQVQLYFSKQQEDKIYSLNRTAFIQKKEISSLGTVCHASMNVNQLKDWKEFIVK